PEGSAERNGPGRVRLHPRERAVLQDGSPTLFVDRDLQERRNPTDLPGHVALEIREMDESDVGEVANLPPAPNVLPERPEGVPIAVHPVAPVLPDVIRRRFDGRAYPTRRLVQRPIPGLVGVEMVVVHAPDDIASIAADVDVPRLRREAER